MAVREIVVWPDSRLRQDTVEIPEINDEVRALYRDLVDTMYAHNGLGIAAIQIGEAARMFLCEAELAGGAEGDDPWAFINPEILEVSEENEKNDEGCLSFPGIYVPIARPVRAKVRAMNINGEIFEVEGEGLYARCLLHEYDHLTGKLMVDFVGPLKKQMIKRKLAKRGREIAEEEAESA
jgi:peptide deformylase